MKIPDNRKKKGSILNLFYKARITPIPIFDKRIIENQIKLQGNMEDTDERILN